MWLMSVSPQATKSMIQKPKPSKWWDGSRTMMLVVSWMVVMTTMTYNNNTDREMEGCVHSFSSVWNMKKKKKNVIQCGNMILLERKLDADDCMRAVREWNMSQELLRMPKKRQVPNANDTTGHHPLTYQPWKWWLTRSRARAATCIPTQECTMRPAGMSTSIDG